MRQSSGQEGTSTASSFKSVGEQSLPYLIPQKTNALTGASTKYFSGKQPEWNGTFQQLVKFQKERELLLSREEEEAEAARRPYLMGDAGTTDFPTSFRNSSAPVPKYGSVQAIPGGKGRRP